MASALDEVVSLELRLLDPETRRNAAKVERLLHPGFREIGASGRLWDRDSMVASLADDPGEPSRASEVTARFVSDRAVLVTYAVESAGARSLRSSLWVGGDDGWQILFHQGTPA
jgi:ribonuclease HI